MKTRKIDMDAQQISIKPFESEDQEAVQSLILAGLAEHWGEIDPTLNPDLNDISAYLHHISRPYPVRATPFAQPLCGAGTARTLDDNYGGEPYEEERVFIWNFRSHCTIGAKFSI